jgi:hypothetical protein
MMRQRTKLRPADTHVIATDVHVEHSDGSDDGLACRNNADLETTE